VTVLKHVLDSGLTVEQYVPYKKSDNPCRRHHQPRIHRHALGAKPVGTAGAGKPSGTGTLGIDLAPGVSGKNTAPHDIARSPLPHVRYLLLPKCPENRRVGQENKKQRSHANGENQATAG